MFLLLVMYTNYVFLKTIPELLSMLSNAQLISLMCFAIVAGVFILDEIDDEKPQFKEIDSPEKALQKTDNSLENATLKNELTITKLYMNGKSTKETEDRNK